MLLFSPQGKILNAHRRQNWGWNLVQTTVNVLCDATRWREMSVRVRKRPQIQIYFDIICLVPISYLKR